MLALTLLLLTIAACSCGAQVSGESLAGARTQADLDSALARSSLPGSGVARAVRETGRQRARTALLDSLR